MAARTTSRRLTYTPAQIERMSAKNINATLSALRSIAQKRQKRLRASGLTTGELATRPLPKISSLTAEDRKAELADLSRLLRDPRSTVSGERHYEEAVRRALAESDYQNIAKGDLKSFGDFMSDMRDRYIDRIYGSSIVAALYDAAAQKGVSGKTLQRSFKKYLESAEGIDKLRRTLEDAELKPGRKRMTSRELKEMAGPAPDIGVKARKALRKRK